MRTTRRSATLAVLLAAAVTLSACSSSDEPSSDGTTTTTAAPVYDAPAGEAATGAPVPSAGCETGDQSDVTLAKQYLDDSDRWYLLTTPEGYDPRAPVPLVLDIHGLAEGAEVHAKMSDFTTFAKDLGVIVVTPHGTGAPVKWEIGLDPETNPDLVYMTDLLDQLEARLCVDTSRVYATGLSNGAFMSSVLGCTQADRITAIAPVAGVLYPEGCEPSRRVPVLAFHGTEDPILLFNGGVGDRLGNVVGDGSVGPSEGGEEAALPEADLDGEGFPANVASWAEHNGCTDFADEDLSDALIERVYDCPAEGATEFLISEGAGHTWPGSEFSTNLESIMGPTDNTIEANELIWSFFQRFQLPPA